MTLDWRQYAQDHPRLVEAALITLLCAASGPAALYASRPYAEGLGWASAVPLAAVASLALLWRRSHPRVVLMVTAVCAAAAAGVGYLLTPLLLAPVMAALYELAVRVPRRASLGYCLTATAVIVPTALFGDRFDHPWPLTTINPIFCLILPVVAGSVTRLRHAYLHAVQARAEYAERTREDEARHRVAEERMRIARELHDVVAHHLALANAQAGTATYLARTSPDEAEHLLTALAGTTSSALRELKATVGLLRQAGDTDSPLDPAPGLHQLPDLTATLASAGLDVDVTIEGRQQPLSPGVDLTAYRIVQEALTNVTRHAATPAACVRLAYGSDRLTITITNDAGPTPPATNSHGFGLIGMRERAHATGGHFEAGHRPGGGFTVTAELPILH
ncbi:histidine kinase [Nonomuraea rosea]|uniref:histidine kinase n=1 Tax=Nonomuraea rosea TaxID=638574 RepID=A0ABP7A4V7_9ACTN